MLFTYGTLSDRTKDFIKDAVLDVNESNTNAEDIPYRRVRLALYLIMLSPDFAIMK